MIFQQLLLLSLLPTSLPTSPLFTLTHATELHPRRLTTYTPDNWALPPNMPYVPQLTIASASATSKTSFNYCVRSGGTLPSTYPHKETGVTESCKYRLDAMGPSHTSATATEGPCLRFGDTTRASNRTGFWCSEDINCVLFYDTDCRYRVNEKEMPSVVLQPPGIGDLSHGWWQERSGPFLRLRGDFGGWVPGPRSAQCFWRGRKQVGLGG